MKFRDYFSKEFGTSDRHEYDTLRTHYYRGRVEEVNEKVCEVLKRDNCIIKGVDLERHEINFDNAEYSGVATLSVVSFTEIAVDFQVMTFNILPGAKGKKVIEKLYSELDKELELKKIGG